jgi:hypothetical protein
LGPILFLIYINDIVDIFGKDLTAKLYADDVKMYTVIDDISCIASLQSDLDRLGRWADEWQLSIAVNKCSVLHIGKNNKAHSYTLQSHSLNDVSEVTDLGLIVDHKLRFSSHYASIVRKAHKHASLILRCFKCRDISLLTKAYLVYVRPLLEYCSPVWAPVYTGDILIFTSYVLSLDEIKMNILMIESVQRRFTKRLSGMSHLFYHQRLRKLNLVTLEARRLQTDLITMFKMLNNYINIDFNDLFQISGNVNTRGHRFKLVKPQCQNNVFLFSFACRRIDVWNSLPDRLVNSESIGFFKNSLKKH